MAEFPDRVKKLIVEQTVQKECEYKVKLYINGERRLISVDDYFCVDQRTNEWAFTSSKENEIWVQLVEKAWAKACGTYAKTIGGHCDEALYALTGAPTEKLVLEDMEVDELWDELSKADEKKYIMGCAVGSEDYDGEHDYKGLDSNHAYTLIGVLVVDGERLVRLRNPWGNVEWQGDWCDSSELWTPDLRREHGVTDANDGVFHMSVEDFQSEYDSVTICKVHDNYTFENVKCEKIANGNGSFFTLKKKQHVFLTLSQKMYRQYSRDLCYYAFRSKLLLGRVSTSGGGVELVGHRSKYHKQNTVIEAYLEPGTY